MEPNRVLTIYLEESNRIFKEIGCCARILRMWLCLRSFCWYETTLKALFFENDAALWDIWNACLIRNSWIFKNFIHVLDYWTMQILDVSYVVIIVLTGKLIFLPFPEALFLKLFDVFNLANTLYHFCDIKIVRSDSIKLKPRLEMLSCISITQ